MQWGHPLGCSEGFPGVVVLYTGDELDALFEGAEQGDSEQGGKDGGFSGPKAVLSSFARFMGSLSK